MGKDLCLAVLIYDNNYDFYSESLQQHYLMYDLFNQGN